MYRIYAGENLIYSPTLIRKDYIITAAQLNMELNKASTFKFTIPNQNARKQFLDNFLKTEICVWDDDRRLFRGRIISKTKDFYQNREITCEGELAYLRDFIVRPYETTKTAQGYFTYMMGNLNGSDLDTFKKFQLGTCDVNPGGASADFANNQYPDFLSEMTDKLLNAYGGYFIPRYDAENDINYLDYLTDPGGNETERLGAQSIRYAKNLLDLTEEINAAPLYTVVIPLGATTNNERLTIGDNPGVDDYIAADPSIIAEHGWIENVVAHDQIKNRAELRTAGQEDINNAVNLSTTVKVSAVDLTLVNEADEPLTIGKQYKILFNAGGYGQESPRMRLTRCEIDLLKPENSRYFFGAVTYGITHEAVSTKRTMNQVTRLAIETAAAASELTPRVTALESAVQNIPKSVNTTVSNLSWTVNADGGKTATATVSLPSGVSGNYNCVASVTTSGAVVLVAGIDKNSTDVSITLLNFGATDPTSLSLDVSFFK